MNQVYSGQRKVNKMPISERLRTVRKRAGFTQRQVADYIGVTESAYCGYETGKRQPDPAKISAIASLLHVTGDYILGLVDEPTAYYGVDISDTDPQMDEIAAICQQLNAQGKEYVRLFAEITAGNPAFQATPSPRNKK